MTSVESALRGTYGRVWLEGEEIGILSNIDLTVTPNYQDVVIGFTVDRQVVSVQYSGSLTFESVNSVSVELYNKFLKNSNMRFTIECNLSDPVASGSEEGYTINGVSFDNFPLANWKKGALVEKSFNFRASDIVVTDKIN